MSALVHQSKLDHLSREMPKVHLGNNCAANKAQYDNFEKAYWLKTMQLNAPAQKQLLNIGIRGYLICGLQVNTNY